MDFVSHSVCHQLKFELTRLQQAAKKVYEDGSEEWIQAYLDQVRT